MSSRGRGVNKQYGYGKNRSTRIITERWMKECGICAPTYGKRYVSIITIIEDIVIRHGVCAGEFNSFITV